jgi:hypothetical protein
MRSFAILPVLLLLLLPLPLRAQLEHGQYDFRTTIGGQEFRLTYDGTHDVMADPDPGIARAIFVHHGGSQNPTTYFRGMMAALEAADADRPSAHFSETTLVVSPGMIGRHHIEDRPDRYADGHYPYWDNGWREGANSLNQPAVSNYDLLDALVLHVANQYPNLEIVVQIGHSAGGQLVSRYSVGTPTFDTLRARGIFVRYIITNPSSVLYFDRQRPDLSGDTGFIDYSDTTPVVGGVECPGFNRYKYGWEDRVPYMTRRSIEEMLAGFRERQVFLFQGLEDNDPDGEGVDRSCPGLLQGRYRLERGRRYYEYWGHFFGPEVYRDKFIEFAPGVGHSSGEMFRSEPGKALIFFDAAGTQPPGTR